MTSRRAVISIMCIAAVSAVWVVLSAVSSTQTVRTNRSQAVRVADQMLSQLVIPAGATRIATVPKTGTNFLDGPFLRYLIVSQVDRSRLWNIPGSAAAVIASIKAHLPKDAKPGEGTSGGSDIQISYTLPTIDPHTLGARQIVLAAVGGSSGDTTVRADAEIRYIAPHPNNEQIPTESRVLDITVGSNLSHPLRSLAITNAAEITQIARVVNDLPFAGNQNGLSYNCPAAIVGAPLDRFVFRRSRSGPALASVTELASEPSYDDPCSSTALTVRGHHEPDLQDGGILITQASTILHVRLAR